MRAAPTVAPAAPPVTPPVAVRFEAPSDGGFDAPADGGEPPSWLGEQLAPPVRAELHALLSHAGGQLESAYRARISRPDVTTPAALLEFTECSTVAALVNRLAVVDAVFNRQRPAGPSIARQAAVAVRSLFKTARDEAVRAHLTAVAADLDELADDAVATRREEAELEAQGAELEMAVERKLRDETTGAAAVYVYTYPHYWKHPYVPGTERRLLRVGTTDGSTFTRIRAQSRQTGAPEDPLLLRVYVAPEPAATSRAFHRLLDAADQADAEGTTIGPDWYSTTLEFCDEIAAALRLEPLSA
jgi:hypothetical protein